EKVDAVIRLGERLVPVDAKFPLENFQRIQQAEQEADKKAAKKTFVQDVKKHIEAIAQKYIRPDEGTYDFALMYVPAENVYYEVIVKDELTEGEHSLSAWAMGKRVIPVSPNTLYVYLMTILLGLKGLKVEKMAQEILASLSRLGGDIDKVRESFRKVGTHLSHAQGAFDEAQGKLGRFQDRLERIQSSSAAGEEKAAEIAPADENVRLLS
ncbi:MAG: DNA recombination protein RmuC, partial [Candidatus Binatia bacterium]